MSDSLGGMKMNKYKIQKIVEYIRQKGRLPTDQFDHILSAEDILGWYGLEDLLGTEERLQVKREIESLIDAQIFMDQINLESY